jgi:hypothetical protein
MPIHMSKQDILIQIQLFDRLRAICIILQEDTLLFKLTCCMLLIIGERPVK